MLLKNIRSEEIVKFFGTDTEDRFQVGLQSGLPVDFTNDPHRHEQYAYEDMPVLIQGGLKIVPVQGLSRNDPRHPGGDYQWVIIKR